MSEETQGPVNLNKGEHIPAQPVDKIEKKEGEPLLVPLPGDAQAIAAAERRATASPNARFYSLLLHGVLILVFGIGGILMVAGKETLGAAFMSLATIESLVVTKITNALYKKEVAPTEPFIKKGRLTQFPYKIIEIAQEISPQTPEADIRKILAADYATMCLVIKPVLPDLARYDKDPVYGPMIRQYIGDQLRPILMAGHLEVEQRQVHQAWKARAAQAEAANARAIEDAKLRSLYGTDEPSP